MFDHELRAEMEVRKRLGEKEGGEMKKDEQQKKKDDNIGKKDDWEKR